MAYLERIKSALGEKFSCLPSFSKFKPLRKSVLDTDLYEQRVIVAHLCSHASIYFTVKTKTVVQEASPFVVTTISKGGEKLAQKICMCSMNLDSIKSSGYSFLFEMLYNVERCGWKVGEVPIFFEDRRLGASKISKSEIAKALLAVFRLAPTRLTGKRA